AAPKRGLRGGRLPPCRRRGRTGRPSDRRRPRARDGRRARGGRSLLPALRGRRGDRFALASDDGRGAAGASRRQLRRRAQRQDPRAVPRATKTRIGAVPDAAVGAIGAGRVSTLFDRRSSGILLHPTCLPGPHGIGDLGSAAHRFADYLKRAGQSWWQMLPVGPPGAGNSPYDSPSSFAGSALLVSLELLVEDGLLRGDEVTPPAALGATDHADHAG